MTLWERLLKNKKNRLTKLEAFVLLNTYDESARQYTYDQFPKHYVWNDANRKWMRRKRGFQIERFYFARYISRKV